MSQKYEARCPFCGGLRLSVSVETTAIVDFDCSDGHEVEELEGDIEWSDESVTRCLECDYVDSMKEFSPSKRIFYVLKNAGNAVFVKTAKYFHEQGGHRLAWGRNWTRILASSLEEAREIGRKTLEPHRG